tara:strand:- start:107 stop:1189 length:1083 start_codon:yes stop_codon:yes gene_type:complete
MFVADLHNDVLQRAILGEDISLKTNHGHSDLERLKNSCIDLEVFVIWIPEVKKTFSPFEQAMNLLKKLQDLERNNNIKIIKNLEEILNSKKEKVLATPFSLEGGEPIEDKIENLHYFIDNGLFYFGPTWNRSLKWVSSNYDEKHNRKNIQSYGLNNFGREIIKTCNENGVIVDVSHIGEKSFWDVKKISNKPFIASHSSVHKLCSHHRNLKDSQILAIKESEGLIGLNPYPFFIDPKFKFIENQYRKKIAKKLQEISSEVKDKNTLWLKKQHLLQKELKAITPSLDIFINHIEYIIKLAGIDFVAIGSDYDGLDCLPKEINDCQDHIKIAEKLDERGYSQNDIEKIMGLNVLRVVELVKN